MRRAIITVVFSSVLVSLYSQTGTSVANPWQNSGTILNIADTTTIKLVGLPCPNSSARAGSWSFEDAQKGKNNIYNMQPSTKYWRWQNPTSGGAVHINRNDEIEVYKSTLGVYQGMITTKEGKQAINVILLEKDSAVIVKSAELWYSVMGIGEGNETSVLLTSEYDLKKSRSLQKILEVLFRPGVQIYYLAKGD